VRNAGEGSVRWKGYSAATFANPGGVRVRAACRKVWHAKCYECLAQGQFPMKKVVDEEGNV
jgi:hypothetical protein